jgi:NAD(P)-dependent dehydrogenase (short-subunit alcohol dehydrogenase family)
MTEYRERTAYLYDAPVALIIGCGDMGLGCARALGRRSPLLVVDIDADRLERCIETLRQEGYTAEAFACDITDEARLAGLGERLQQLRGVKVLAHVAAIGGGANDWRAIMRVDLLAGHLVARAVEPHMVRGGVAIFVSSTGAYQCPADPMIEAYLDDPFEANWPERLPDILGREPDHLIAYFAAKQGINRLAERLAVEWGEREVRVLSVSPGLINSTMGRTDGTMLPILDSHEHGRMASRSEKAVREVPLGRQGSVLEITAVIDFLASDAASFISGIDVPIDGASTAKRRAAGLIER